MTVISVAVLAVLLPFVLFDLLVRPTIRRLALRNVVRRPGEAALVVGGALLATALITASFIIGDSFGSSIRNLAVDRWGPIDEVVFVAGPAAIQPTQAIVEQVPDRLVDGVLGASLLDVSVSSVAPERHVEPEVTVLEIDPGPALTFSGDPELFGPEPARLGPGDVVINERLAEQLRVAAGDELEVFLGGDMVRLEVAAVRPAIGLNGLGQLLVVPGALTERLDDPAALSTSAVLVSNVGGVFEGSSLTEAVIADLEARLADHRSPAGPVSIEGVKQDLLDDAELEAAEMTELFGTVGGFSVAAGILLVVNLFVMLAGERRAEMGTLRATGLRRGHLVRAYSLEGAVYGVAASLIGVVVGIGVAAVVMRMAGGLFDGELTIRLAVVGTSLVSGAVIGLAVSQVTVLVTSWRVTRMNIVRAIRELPEPPSAGHRRRSLAIGIAGVVGGVVLYLGAGTTPVVAMLAPVLALVAAVPLLARVVPRRLAVVLGCGGALAWVAAVFGLLPAVMDDPEIYLFLLQGVLLVGLATVIVAVGDRLWLAAARRVTGGGIASRIGLAEPLARPVRTALLVAMYALVIFTVTFMAVMNSVFQAQAPEFAIQAGGGYDLYVESHATSGLSARDLSSRPDVDSVAPVRRGWITGGPVDDETLRFDWRASGVTPSFLDGGPPALAGRSDEFASDGDAWAAVTGSEPH
ncbi:MAG: ABC transporter permease, partial [Acidimicrobiia bacterium]|nr:ABC transporter permease [Acidimicrobiia bacterium]